MRCLGIPARPITNFNSGHESKPYNYIIEQYYTRNGAGIWKLDRSGGSKWNYHVWVDAWMARPDIGYAGWQAIDATPQEQSDGSYRVGPAPVAAVKSRTLVNYDVDFVVGEVDSDWQRYLDYGGGNIVPYGSLITNKIGHNISTKEPGSLERRDITGNYKTPDPPPPPLPDGDVSLDAPDSLPLGASLSGQLSITNSAGEARTFVYGTRIVLEMQNGQDAGEMVPWAAETVVLQPQEMITVPITFSGAEIVAWAPFNVFVRIDASVECIESGEVWIPEHRTLIEDVALSLEVNPVVVEPGGIVFATAMFTNPLAEPLTNAVLTLDGGTALLIDGQFEREEILLGDVAPGQQVFIDRTITAIEEGSQVLLAFLRADNIRVSSAASEVLVRSCLADFNGDGIVNTQDFIAFLGAWSAGDPLADWDENGIIDTRDFVAFLGDWAAGC